MSNVSMDVLKEEVRKILVDNKLRCEDALELSRRLNIRPNQIGKAANLLKVKICGCQLGCFK